MLCLLSGKLGLGAGGCRDKIKVATCFLTLFDKARRYKYCGCLDCSSRLPFCLSGLLQMGDKSALYSSLEIHVDFQSTHRLWSLTGTDIDCDWVAEHLTYMGLPRQDVITKQEYHPIHGDLETGKVYRAQLRRSGASEDTASLTVALKWATTADTIDRLYNEACMYEGNLKRLQGTFVPKFYGLFLAKIGVTPVGCIVLEWCCGTPTQNIRELKCVSNLFIRPRYALIERQPAENARNRPNP